MRGIITIIFSILSLMSFAQDSIKVFIMEIKAPIDTRSNRYTELALEQASQENVDYVIIEMNTYGGAVNDADEIRQRILDYPKPVYVFINKNAASAGALISIACDSIYMTPGANIGAATVVTQDGAAAPDKYQSYMRSMMRSTAEVNGRNPKIAEAMVDQNLVVDSVSKEGEVVTFTTEEAMKHGFCEGKFTTIEEVLSFLKLDQAEIIRYEQKAAEGIISFFLNPAISGILIMIMLGGIYYELQTPGVGFPIAAAILAAILYFTPYYLNGLAENWEIALFLVGLVLIGVEVFVIPGFGVAGILGIGLTVSSLFLVMLNNDFFDFTFVPDEKVSDAGGILALSLIGSFLMVIVFAQQILKSPIFKKIGQFNELKKEDGYVSGIPESPFIGLKGEALTVLRPSGKVKIDGEIYDAETKGSFVDKGEKIIVIKGGTTSSLLVRKES